MFRWQGEDLILELKVIPKSTIDRLEVDADQLKLKIRAMPIDGKANQYLKKYRKLQHELDEADERADLAENALLKIKAKSFQH